MRKPKLTIITINYNNRDGLKKTIESVVTQKDQDFEYIVIDGGSTDGSVEIIKEYEKFIDYWISEPDAGIYNAMNKGVAVAHGEYCNFLNSGDFYYDNEVVRRFNNYPPIQLTDIVLGYEVLVDDKGKEHFHRDVKDEIHLLDLVVSAISHQSSFIRTEICRKYPYDENYKIVSDWKFYLESNFRKLFFFNG